MIINQLDGKILNACSDVSGLAWTPGEIGICPWTVKIPAGTFRGAGSKRVVATTFSTSSRAHLRRARPSGPDRALSKSAGHRGEALDRRRCLPWAGWGSGVSPPRAAAWPTALARKCTAWAAAAAFVPPQPPPGGPRRHAPWRPCLQEGRAVLLAPGDPVAAQDHCQERSLRSRRHAMALRATPDSDHPRQRPGTCREDGSDAEAARLLGLVPSPPSEVPERSAKAVTATLAVT